MERYRARWVVHRFMKIPDFHFNPGFASTSSLLVVILMRLKHNLNSKQPNVTMTLLRSLLAHEVWVSFLAECAHPPGHSFAKLRNFL